MLDENKEEKNFDQRVLHIYADFKEPQLKVELTRGQKGNYGWSISYSSKSIKETLDVIFEVDQKLRERIKEIAEG